MTKLFCILLLCGLTSTNGWTQTSNGQGPTNTANQETASSTVSLDVLFATNEDCDLYINGQFKAAVTKNAHKYIKLSPGNYSYTAKSRSTASAFEEKFVVKEGKVNEVFIDLLYFIDLQQQANSNTVNKQLVTAGVSNSSKRSETSKQEGNVAASKLSETQVVQILSSNMISISGGSFIMGNNKAPATDETEHTVTIGPVLFGKYEVTQEQWGAIMGYNPSENKGCLSCPVENVSWDEVMKFIKKLNTLSTRRFRLPTEAEWEFVARLGGKEEIEKAGGQEEYIKKSAWYFGNADKKTHPIGLKQSNVSGIYDLYGNVSEWCYDWYSPNYYKEENNQMDPDGPPSGKEKVYRGGSFEDYGGDRFRPSLRNKMKPTGNSKSVGFRLVMDIK